LPGGNGRCGWSGESPVGRVKPVRRLIQRSRIACCNWSLNGLSR